MLVTEEQARTKWCPLALGAGARILGADGDFVPAGPAVNRSMEGLPLALACCGSGCMAWRPCGAQRETIRNYHDDTEIPVSYANGQRTYPDGWQYGHTDKDQAGRSFDLLHRAPNTNAPVVGYCGAFGKPEG